MCCMKSWCQKSPFTSASLIKTRRSFQKTTRNLKKTYFCRAEKWNGLLDVLENCKKIWPLDKDQKPNENTFNKLIIFLDKGSL